jgi:hypothetical protein
LGKRSNPSLIRIFFAILRNIAAVATGKSGGTSCVEQQDKICVLKDDSRKGRDLNKQVVDREPLLLVSTQMLRT